MFAEETSLLWRFGEITPRPSAKSFRVGLVRVFAGVESSIKKRLLG